MQNIQPVVLCGGSGTRLWPLSRASFPKQFHCLAGKESLFQQAVGRLEGLASDKLKVLAPIIVSNEDHRFLILEQLVESGIELGMALLEPVGRNTAPAMTLAALAALENDMDPILVVTPADQIVTDLPAFTFAIQRAVEIAETNTMVIFGVLPDRPETGYGYIKPCAVNLATEGFMVERFIEKPDALTAKRFFEEGGYYWNAGIFVMKASVWISALKRFREDIAISCMQAWSKRSYDHKFVRPPPENFIAIPAESVDYAVIQHCPGSDFRISMLPLIAGWDDLGAWDALWKRLPKDTLGNVHSGDVLTSESRNNLVYASNRLVAMVGVENLVVVETADAVLVTDKSSCQKVKAIVNHLNTKNRKELTLHRKVYRPWGWYDNVDEGSNFKVKRILVKPKASLSLQKHHHRAEHWVVVNGVAEVICGDKTVLLSKNQSIFIPQGEIHRLSNPGTIPLEIIEVQSGNYLGEDDIVRFEDMYGR